MSFRTWASAVAAVALIAGCASASPGSSAGTPRSDPSAVVATPTAIPITSPASAAPTAAASAELVAGAKRTPLSGEMEPARYYTERNTWTPVTFSYEIVAPGWISENSGQTITKDAGVEGREISWSVEILSSLFATPCGADDRVAVGPSVANLIAGLDALPDLILSEPRDLVVDSRAGHVIELSMREGLEEASCDPPIGLQVWLDQAGGKYLVVGQDQTTRVYAVDVDGRRFILNANYRKNANPAGLTEFEAIVKSIRFHG